VAVEGLRLAGVDLAEVAAARALVTTDEERRLAVLPALEDVGAARLLADRVQALGLHQAVELGVRRPHLRPGLDPLRLALDRGLAIADLEPQQPAAVRSDVAGGGLGHPPMLRGGGTPSGGARRRETADESAEVPGVSRICSAVSRSGH